MLIAGIPVWGLRDSNHWIGRARTKQFGQVAWQGEVKCDRCGTALREVLFEEGSRLLLRPGPYNGVAFWYGCARCAYQRYMPALLVLVVAVMAACTMGVRPDNSVANDARTAAEIFAEMENRLLEASAISGRYTVSADGAISASLRGTLEISGAETDLTATGVFGEDSVALYLRSEGRIMEGGNAARRFHEEAPAGLTEAVLLGFTRMGILHNLFRTGRHAFRDLRLDGTGSGR